MPSENLSLDPTYILRHSQEKVSTVAFVSFNNEETVCCGTEKGNIIFWELKCFRPLLTFEGHPGKAIQHLLPYADKHILSQGKDGWIRCWDQNGTQSGEWSCSEHLFAKMSLFNDALAYADKDEGLSILDLKKNQSLYKLPKITGRGFLFSIILMSLEKLVLAFEDGNIYLLHLPTQTETSVLSLSPEDPIFCLHFLDGNAAGISFQGTLTHFCLKDEKLVLSSQKKLKCEPSSVLRVSLQDELPLTVVGSSQGTVRLYGYKSQKFLAKLSYHNEGIVSLSFSTKHQLLAAASKDKKISLWNIDCLLSS